MMTNFVKEFTMFYLFFDENRKQKEMLEVGSLHKPWTGLPYVNYIERIG